MNDENHDDAGLTIHCSFHISRGRNGRTRMKNGKEPDPPPEKPGTILRVSRLMALAIRYEKLMQEGHVKGHADLARIGVVSRARVTQIMNLVLLAPDIQEEILFLPLRKKGRDAITEHDVRDICAAADWKKQRRLWKKMKEARGVEVVLPPE